MRQRIALFLVLSAAMAMGTAAAGRAVAAEKAAKTKAAVATGAASPDWEAVLKPLRFREIGPATMGGRIDDFAVVESNPDVLYVGAATGGVLKTENGGITWQPIFDNEA